MTEFRVLPVRSGDACIIRCRRGDYLFDGGIDGCRLPEMLARRKIKRLRVAACTSLVRERIGGVLDLLEADFPVGEYWLPDDIRELVTAAMAFNGDWRGWDELAGNAGSDHTMNPGCTSVAPGDTGRWLEGAVILLELGFRACGEPLHGPVSRPAKGSEGSRLAGLLTVLAERATTRWRAGDDAGALLGAMTSVYAAGGDGAGLARICGRLLLEEADRLPGGVDRGLKAQVTTLALAGMTAALLARTTARIQFFRGEDRLTDRLISNHPIKVLNGLPVHRWPKQADPVSPKAMLALVKRCCNHSRSLVFQYGEASCSVLLCGDSRFSFMGHRGTLLLDRPTATLVPCQGGAVAEKAYRHITSMAPEMDLWVRGAPMGTRKMSNYFRYKQNSLCLEHCQHHAVQEILLRNDGLGWERLAGCLCRD